MSDVDVLLSMGKNDPIVSIDQSEHVINLFKHQGAQVTEVWVNSHEITQAGLQKGQEILNYNGKGLKDVWFASLGPF